MRPHIKTERPKKKLTAIEKNIVLIKDLELTIAKLKKEIEQQTILICWKDEIIKELIQQVKHLHYNQNKNEWPKK